MHLLTENYSRIPCFQERRKKNASLRHETIADAADGDDVLGRAGVVLDLAAQAVDVDHDGVVVHSDEVSPYLLVDHILGEHLLRVAHKEQQQAALFLGEVQLHIVFIKAHGGGVAEEGPAADLLVVLLREALAAADEGLDLCTQDLGAEGLDDIVVGAQREAVHEIVVLVAAADDDDRRGDAVAPDGLDVLMIRTKHQKLLADTDDDNLKGFNPLVHRRFPDLIVNLFIGIVGFHAFLRYKYDIHIQI